MLVHRSLLEAGRCASQDSLRYQLCGVYLEKKGDDRISATATDGKTLIHVSRKADAEDKFPLVPGMPEAGDGLAAGDGVILPSDVAKKIGKQVPRCAVKPILENFALAKPNGAPRLDVGIVDDDINPSHLSVGAIEGTFPDYRLLTERKDATAASVKLNPALVIQAMETVIALSGTSKAQWIKNRSRVFVEMNVVDGKKPIEFRLQAENGNDVRAFVMPVVSQ